MIFIKLLTVLILIQLSASYTIPALTVEILSPQGIRVSIPDSPGNILFAFHGSVNHELKGASPGEFHGEVRRPINDRWIYENKNVIIKPGDILYYWVHVQNGQRGYREIERSITIPEPNLYITNEMLPTSTSTTTTTHRTTTQYSRITTKRPTRPTITETREKNCKLSITKVRGQSVCEKELIFEDDFNNLDWSKWRREVKIPLDSDDADFVSFQNRPENCYISSGMLHIVPNLLTEVPGFSMKDIRNGKLDFGAECTANVDVDLECKREAGIFRILPPIVSARIRSKESFSFRYGQLEIRAKLPIGDWLFPQIFLEPLTNQYGVIGYASGQIRIAFIHGNENLETKDSYEIDGRRLFGGIILTSGDNYRDLWLKSILQEEHLGNDFHNYSMIWNEETISFLIDGYTYGTIRGGFSKISKTHNIIHAQQWENGDFIAPFDHEFYIALGVSAGGISDFPDGCKTGLLKELKPWENTSPKAELKFWNARNSWYKSWDGADSGMKIDYIKVWAL